MFVGSWHCLSVPLYIACSMAAITGHVSEIPEGLRVGRKLACAKHFSYNGVSEVVQ